jgi:hypothetical protein
MKTKTNVEAGGIGGAQNRQKILRYTSLWECVRVKE